MERSIPLPTDNIFKFYALFGLLLFIFSWGSVLYVNSSSNEVVFTVIPELEGLKQVVEPSKVEVSKMALLEQKLEITQSNKKFFLNGAAVILVIGTLLMIYGFSCWHRYLQPVLDRTAKAQMDIAELQLKKLQREFEALTAIPPSGAAHDCVSTQSNVAEENPEGQKA